jgi:PadR family transcriptional regulator AphA
MAELSSSLILEYILLGLLQGEPDHGYALFERIQGTPELSLIWQVKRSKLYYLLEKLAREGLLAISVSPREGYPDRKVFQITEQGKEAFQAWVRTPVQSSRQVRITFLSKLYFALGESPVAAEDLINTQLEMCQNWIDSLKGELAERSGESFLTRQVMLFRIGQVEAMVKWLSSCRDQLPTNGPIITIPLLGERQ